MSQFAGKQRPCECISVGGKMKITTIVELTPVEVRGIFGLPDVAPMQQEMVKKLENIISDELTKISPDNLLQKWFPNNLMGGEKVQEMFAKMFGQVGNRGGA
jgi:hypothetical protein